LKAVKEILYLLRRNRLEERIIRCRKHGYEDLTLDFLTGLNIHVGECISGIVNMKVFTSGTVLSHYKRWLLDIQVLVYVKAKLRILISIRIVLLVLLPKQITGDMGLVLVREFFRNVRKTPLKVIEPFVRVSRIASCEAFLQYRIV